MCPRLHSGQQVARNFKTDTETIMQSWDVTCGSWNYNHSKSISWCQPPLGVLKVNFDGNYVREEHWGGFGSLICDHDGTVICNYSGLIGATNAIVNYREEISSLSVYFLILFHHVLCESN